MMMRELDRGELLDRLPDYVHGTLPADERAAVEAALARDSGMVSELELIRTARTVLASGTPSVNVDGVLAALRHPAPARNVRFSRWRIAAAVATLAVGGASLAIVQQGFRDAQDPPTVVGETASVSSADVSVSFGYDLSELSPEDLEKLLDELKASAGVPGAEPAPAGVTLVSEEIQ